MKNQTTAQLTDRLSASLDRRKKNEVKVITPPAQPTESKPAPKAAAKPDRIRLSIQISEADRDTLNSLLASLLTRKIKANDSQIVKAGIALLARLSPTDLHDVITPVIKADGRRK